MLLTQLVRLDAADEPPSLIHDGEFRQTVGLHPLERPAFAAGRGDGGQYYAVEVVDSALFDHLHKVESPTL
jgi:hypothetical protein